MQLSPILLVKSGGQNLYQYWLRLVFILYGFQYTRCSYLQTCFTQHHWESSADYSGWMPTYCCSAVTAYHFEWLWDYSEYHSFSNLIFAWNAAVVLFHSSCFPLDNSKTWNELFKYESCALWTIQCTMNTDVYCHKLLTSFWDELCFNLEMSKLMENMNRCRFFSVALAYPSLRKAAEFF